MNSSKQLHWPLIIGLGAFALVRPLMNVTGLMEGLGRPFGPVLVTVLISLAWLVIVVVAKVRQPILTLILTGLTYGIFAIIIGAVLSPILDGQLAGPIANPLATVSVLVTNAIWGGFIGVIAWVIQQLNRPASL